MLMIIFRAILAIVHLAYAALEEARARWRSLRCLSSKIYWRFRAGAEYTSEYEGCRARLEKIAIEDCLERAKKLPVHLCIVIGERKERVSFYHLARILRWCVAVRIPYVSFYDHDGFLKQNRDILIREWEKMNPELVTSVDWEYRASVTKLDKNGRNGFQRRTRVQILSNDDGKGEIVTLTQNISRAVTHGLIKLEEINTELLHDKLRLENSPEPDVAFVCGPGLATYGLLPWHTRVTEFFNIRSHRDVTIRDFISILDKFGRCQQRYGK